MRVRCGLIVFACLLPFSFAMTGCGGGGGSSTSVTATPTPSVSRFVGAWSGPWTEPDLGQSGTMTFTVKADGTYSGTVTNASLSGPISGTVASDGNWVYYYSYGSSVTTAPNGTGVLSIDSQGHLIGTLHDVGNGTMTLTRQQ